ncbi:MAG TPA: hypothetical protein VN088_04250 [Nocardioides sp.]|nr:hypothetical protein [Nocardioides sp.]
MTKQEEAPPKIDWPSVLAGAGAAVTVAVLLSTLGAAGTLVGAGLGSVVATVSTALYKQALQSSRRKMAEVQATALHRVGQAQQEVRRAAARSDSPTVASDLARADAHLEGASSELDDGVETEPVEPAPLSVDPAPPTAAQVAPAGGLKALPWRRVALLTAAVFVVAMVAISGFEVLAGRSVSSLTGGTTTDKRTSVSGLFGDTSGRRRQPTPAPAVTATVTTTATPSTPTSAPTSSSPTAAPTASATSTATASPTETATASASEAPTDASPTP